MHARTDDAAPRALPSSSTSDRLESRRPSPLLQQLLQPRLLRGILRIRLTRLAREGTRRIAISAGMQKVNRSCRPRSRRRRKKNAKRKDAREREGGRESRKKKREESRGRGEEAKERRGRVSFTAPAAAPRVIAAATSGGVQRVYVSAIADVSSVAPCLHTFVEYGNCSARL